MRTIIKAGGLVDGSGRPALESSAVLIEDGRIAWVGRAGELAEEVSGAETVVAPEGTLLPGLIDAHVHLVSTGEPTTPWDRMRATDEELLLTAVGNAQAALAAGITTVRDLGGRGLLVPALRDAIDAGSLIGPRILAAGPSITTTGGHFYYYGWEADSSEQAITAVRALCRAGVDLIKVMGTGGNSTPGTNSREAQYTAEQLRAVVEDAHRLGRRVVVHAHGVPGIRNAVAAGVDCVEHCSWLGKTGIEYNEPLADQIAERGIFVSLGMPAIYRLPVENLAGRTSSVEREAIALREARLEALRRMIGLGVTIVVSSDSGMTLTRIQDFALLLEHMVKQVGMTEVATVAAATGLAARALGIESEVGTIEKGKRADLLLVRGDLRGDIASLQRVDRVFLDGKVVRREPPAGVTGS